MARTFGAELLERLHDGRMQEAASAYLAKTREDICFALEELLEVGARIRPLYAGGKPASTGREEDKPCSPWRTLPHRRMAK